MHTLFNDPPVASRGALTFPHFNYVRKQIQTNLERVVNYYRVSPMYYHSDHILVKILQSLNVNIHQDLVVYRDKVEDRTDAVARSLRLTTASQAGEVPEEGFFYGLGSDEVVVAIDAPFPLTKVRDDWENLQPIRWLRHPKTDMNLDIPMGRQTSEEEGLSVILINIPMLACQYRQWRLRELRDNPENPRSVTQFIGLYPIPNSLYSQIDVAFMNRFITTMQGEAIPEVRDNHPFYLNNYERHLDGEIDKMLTVINRKSLKFENLLESLLPIHANSFREVIELPKIPPTRQVLWALTLARLPISIFLGHWHGMVGTRNNGQEINRMRRSLIELENDKALKQGLPREARSYVEGEVELLEALLS